MLQTAPDYFSMGTYLPRQLIAEKIKTAAANIPQGFGSPEMSPCLNSRAFLFITENDLCCRAELDPLGLAGLLLLLSLCF